MCESKHASGQAVLVVVVLLCACGSGKTAVEHYHDSQDVSAPDAISGLQDLDRGDGEIVFPMDALAEATDVEEDSSAEVITCGKEGEVFARDDPHCCEGLVVIPNSEPDEKGNCGMVVFPSTVCANCYDGICGIGENVCNCPEDCS